MAAVSRDSSSGGSGAECCIDRGWSRTRQARRSERPSVVQQCVTVCRRRAGLEASLGGFLQNQRIQGEVGDRTFQARELTFQLLKPLDLLDFQAAVLIAPTVGRLFDDPQRATDLHDGLAFAQGHFRFCQSSAEVDPFILM